MLLIFFSKVLLEHSIIGLEAVNVQEFHSPVVHFCGLLIIMMISSGKINLLNNMEKIETKHIIVSDIWSPIIKKKKTI